MAFFGDFRTMLLADSAIAAIIGTRIYPLRAPQDAGLPFLVYERLAESDLDEIEGPASEGTMVVRVSAVARDVSGGSPDQYGFDEAHALAKAVRARIGAYTGVTGVTRFKDSRFEDGRDRFDDGLNAFVIENDFRIHYREN